MSAPAPPSLDGVLVIDKPRGPTSHDAVSRLRRALKTRAVGHAGTLDPMATGVLVVALGEATKLVPWLTAHDKAYEATITLGVETDTLDAMGREVRRAPPGEALLAELAAAGPLLESAFEAERARTLQSPPAYSAIREGGERAFDRARRGESFELPPRPVAVRRLDLLAAAVDPPSLDVALEVAKGYYVRSLGRDLALALGTAGHLTMLRRTRSGCFALAEAVGLDAAAEVLRSAVLPLATAAARALTVARLGEAGTRDAGHGRAVAATDAERPPVPPGTPCAWVDPAGDLVAVGEWDEEGRGRVLRGFARER